MAMHGVCSIFTVVLHLVSENESQQTAQCERHVREMNLQSSSGIAQSTPGISFHFNLFINQTRIRA